MSTSTPGPVWPFIPANGTSVVSADGAWLTTSSGQRILDAAGGAIAVNIGHGREEVARVLGETTARLSYVVPPWDTPERTALIHELRDHWLPDGLTRVHLTTGGSDANEAALKIAVQAQAARGEAQRHTVLTRELSYHGTTITTAGISGHVRRKRGLEGFLPVFPAAPTPWPLRCPLGPHHPDAGAFYVAETRKVIEATGPDSIAAFLAEPMIGSSGGAIEPPEGYWEGIRALCDEYGILLILDEVMTGFGRMGTRFGCEHYGLHPDILVAGKGLTGGYASLGGVYARQEIADALASRGWEPMFHTLAALPSACAAATSVLQILRREQLVERVAEVGPRLGAMLQRALGQHAHVAEVRGRGLLWAVEVVRDRDTLMPFDEADDVTGHIIAHAMHEHGVFFYPGGTGVVRDILCLGPPFTSSEAELTLMVDALADSISAITTSLASQRSA